MKGARTKVPGQARDIFFKHPEHRLPYYRLLGRAGQNYLSERVGDMLAINPDLESQNVSMTVIEPGANENSAVANYFRALTPSLFEPKTINYGSPEWQRLLVSDLAPLVDLSRLTGEELFKWDSSPLQHLVATQQLTVEQIKLLLKTQMRDVLKTYGIFQIENLLRFENGSAFFNSIQDLLGTPNFCTFDEFLNLTPDQLSRVKNALPSIKSGKLSLNQCLVLTDEQYKLFNDYSIQKLLGTPNFCTVDEFLNLTSDQLRRVESTLPFIQAEKLSLKECLSLTDEQYALFSNKNVLLLDEKLSKEQVLALTPEILQRIAHPMVASLIVHGIMPLDQALSTPESEYEGYRAIIIVIHITGHRSQYLSREEAFSLTNEEVKSLAWTMRLMYDRNTKLVERGVKSQLTLEAHLAEVLRIAKALTSTQKTWLKAEAFDTKNDEVPLEELFLQVSRLYPAEAPTEAPPPPAQPASVPS